MRVRELGHVVLYVRNIERSVAFYRDLLGFTPIASPGLHAPVAAFSSGRTHHEMLLIEVGEDAPGPERGPRVGLYHIGLKIGDTDAELREALDRLTEAGTPIVGASDHTVTHSLYVLDPDGNEVELYVDMPNVNWDDPEAVFAPVKPLLL
jgi:catechol 2,3-dioxygenase